MLFVFTKESFILLYFYPSIVVPSIFKTCSMGDAASNVIEASMEHKFARDLIRFVLNERMSGLQWTPTDIFAEQDLDSPFTPEFKHAIVKELDCNDCDFHLLYDIHFPDKSLVKTKQYDFCLNMKDKFVNLNFDKRYFIRFCAQLASYAGLSYLYGVLNAPSNAYKLIVACIRELKSLGKVDDEFWNIMQNWLEGKELKEDESEYQVVIEDISDASCEADDRL